MELMSTEVSDYFNTVEYPFIDVEDIGLSIQRCFNGTNGPCTLIKFKINENCEQLKLIYEQLLRSGILVQLPILPLKEFNICRNDEEPEEMWLKCSLTSREVVQSIIFNHFIKKEEAM